MLDRETNITLGNRYTLNALSKTNIDFIGLRKLMYVLSSIVILIGIVSLFVRGLDPSVEFAGGRTYIVRLDHSVQTSDIRAALTPTLKSAPEVKIFGDDNQVKITTKYLIDDRSTKADSIVETALYDGLRTQIYCPYNL